MRSSIAVSSHDSKSGVTGSPIHSPKRSMRVYAPGAGESHETLRWQRRHRPGLEDPERAVRVDRPLDVLRRSARARDAPRLVRHLQCLAAIDGALRLAASGGAVATDDPFVTDGLAGHEPLPEAAHRGDDAGAPIPVDRIGGERHAGRGRRDHALDDHRHAAVAGGLVLGDAGRAGAGQAPIRRRRQVVRGDVQHRLVHAGVGVLRAVLGDAARADRERTRCPGPTRRRRTSQRRSADVISAAAAVRTTPSGTRTPAASSSPRLAALPPTSAASAMRTSRSRRTAGGALIGCFSLCAAAMAARTIQSTSSAASSTDGAEMVAPHAQRR